MKYLLLLLPILFFSCNSTSSEESIKSLIVSQNNKIVSEEYFNQSNATELTNVQSLTKGIISSLIGIAIDERMIANEQIAIHEYFPEEFKTLEADKKKITIEHLLNQTSGLAWKGYLEHADWKASEDPISFVLTKELEDEPGTKYNYNSGATHLLSAILTKASGMSTFEFAKKYLFLELQLDEVRWEKRNKGFYDCSGLGLSTKPIDLMKIGQLLSSGGNFNGKQLISKKWMNKMFDDKNKLATRWGIRGSKHGYCWYKATSNNLEINYGMGYGGQFIILVPSKNLCIVATHNHDTADGLSQQSDFLWNTLPGLLAKYG